MCSANAQSYLHSEVVNEADPSARVFEEHVNLLLESLALPLVEHVLGLERLVNGQVNGVVWVGYAGRRGWFGITAGGDHLDNGRVVGVAARRRRIGEVLARLPALLERRGHPPMMRLAEPGHPSVVVRRPDLLVRYGFLFATVKPLLLPAPLVVGAAVPFRLAAAAAATTAGSADVAARTSEARPLLLLLLLLLFQFSGRDPVDDGRPARPAVACSTAVASQRDFPGLAKQLNLFGAVHVDTKRPRQHPVAAVHMAFRARYASRHTHDPRKAWRDVMSTSVSVAVAAAEVRVATAKSSEYDHGCVHAVSGTRVANAVISLFFVKQPVANNYTLPSTYYMMSVSLRYTTTANRNIVYT